MSEPLIQLDSVSKQYGQETIIDDVSLTITAGRITTLIGPNGAGKTTLVKLLLGLVAPDNGTLTRAANLKVGYMPQKLHIDPTLPLSLLGFLKLANSSDKERKQALTITGIEHLAERPIQSLSGGELQRALLARALLRKPNLLVLDEPVQGVDIGGQEALYQLIGQLRDQLNCAVLMVSHDLHLVMAATDEVVCLNRHICCHGTPSLVTKNPAFIELFGEKTAFYTHVHDHSHGLHGDVICDQGDTKAEQGSCNRDHPNA